MTDLWPQRNDPRAVLPKYPKCRLAADLPPSTNRRWYVFEADYGGQILATIPVEMVPAWVSRRRLCRAMRAMNGMWEKDFGQSVYIVEDFGAYPPFAEWDEDPQAYRFHMEAANPWTNREMTRLPLGLACAQIANVDELTRLPHWQFCGWVEGGMGGGRLLANDAWFHYGILYGGLPHINEMRRLLGLSKLDTLELQMAPEATAHMDLITAVLGVPI